MVKLFKIEVRCAIYNTVLFNNFVTCTEDQAEAKAAYWFNDETRSTWYPV